MYVRGEKAHMCEKSVAFTFASTYAGHMGQRLVCTKRGLEKRRIYVKKRPIYVKRALHSHLLARMRVVWAKDLYVPKEA